MANIKIPPRQDFQVSEQVYEWFRALSTTLEQQVTNDDSDSINALFAFFSNLEKEFNNFQNLVDLTERNAAYIQRLEAQIRTLENDSTNNESIKEELRRLDAKFTDFDVESNLALYLRNQSMVVATQEVTGSFTGTTTNVAISSVNVARSECIVEVRTTDTTGNNSNIAITSEFDGNASVKLTRVGTGGTINYVVKVKEFRNA